MHGMGVRHRRGHAGFDAAYCGVVFVDVIGGQAGLAGRGQLHTQRSATAGIRVDTPDMEQAALGIVSLQCQFDRAHALGPTRGPVRQHQRLPAVGQEHVRDQHFVWPDRGDGSGDPDLVADIEQFPPQPGVAAEHVGGAAFQLPDRFGARTGQRPDRERHMGIAPVDLHDFGVELDDFVPVVSTGMVGVCDKRPQRRRAENKADPMDEFRVGHTIAALW